jgi:hypothetical protein
MLQRIENNSSTVMDNIFVDNSILKSFSTSPPINGLSDQNTGFLTINNIYATINKMPLKKRTRFTNNKRITSFQTLLKNQMRGSAYEN